MKTLIFGYGKYAKDWFEKNQDFCKWTTEKEYEVVGIVDNNSAVWGNSTVFNICISNPKDELVSLFDCIIVTSPKYYDEIEKALLDEYQIDSSRIINLKSLANEYLETLLPLKIVRLKKGIEVGGPSSVFEKIYNECEVCDGVNFSADTVWGNFTKAEYYWKDEPIGKQIIADAVDLNLVPDEGYDFYMSSNNLEHVANPMKALFEAVRVVKKGGIILLVLPNKENNFDHRREYTLFSHLLDDYKKNIGEDDKTHLDEIVKLHDYDMDPWCGGKEKFIYRAAENEKNRCLHHHIFSIDILITMFEYFDIEVLKYGKDIYNLYIYGQKTL